MLQPNMELILGNHESTLLDCDILFKEIIGDNIDKLTGTKLQTYSVWVSSGGQPTLDTLSVIRKSKKKYLLKYLRKAPLYKIITVNNRELLLVHSGLGSSVSNKQLCDYKPTELLWSRPNLNQKYFDGVTTILGHTPTVYYCEEYRGKPLKTESWIDMM